MAVRRMSCIVSAVAAITLLTMGPACAADEDVPRDLREQAPQLLDEAVDAILAGEGSGEFNLDGRSGIAYGDIHRLYRMGGTIEEPELVASDEWLVPVLQDGTPRLRITLWLDEAGEYAFADAAASDDMSYLQVLGDKAEQERLVLLPVSNSLFLADAGAGQVRGVKDDSDGKAVRTLQDLAEFDAEQLTPAGGEDVDEDAGSGSVDDGVSPLVMAGVVAGLIVAGGGAAVVLRRRARAA